MEYHAPTNKFLVPFGNIQHIADSLLYAIKNIRETAKLPLTEYKNDGMLTQADHAQIAIFDIAEKLNINLGAKRHYELDVSKL